MVLVNYVPLSQHCWHATMTAGMKIVLTVAIRWKSNPKGSTPPSQWVTRYPLCGDNVIALGGLTLSGEVGIFWSQ